MKKVLLVLSGAFLSLNMMAQDCTPAIYDTATTLGFVPYPIVGSTEGEAYDEVVTIVIPQKVDNTLTSTPGDSITLCAVSIINVIGMPSGYNYEVWAHHGGNPTAPSYDVLAQTVDTMGVNPNANLTRACLRITNLTPPAPAVTPTDTVLVTVVIGAWANILSCQDLSGAGGTDTFQLKLPQRSSVYVGIENEIDNSQFNVYSNFPNPANGSTTLSYSTPVAGKVTLTVVDAVGRVVRNINLTSKAGLNTYILNTADMNAGVYMYNITHNGKTITKRMIISK